ncbi:MAG: hypothetical protein NWR72_00665 [Bacteroidia bacterium]|nr:hypothetical protein [Bacteroidia bacterium]
MTRSAPAKGSMTYSEGKFKLTLPDLSWYFNGDTLWEQVDGRYNVEIRLGLDPKALSPSEMLEVLNRQPASVKHYGIMDHNGEMCDRLKIDFSGKSLPYETVFLWVNTKRQIVKVLFMDQHQVATTIVLHSIKPIPTPNPLTFSFR